MKGFITAKEAVKLVKDNDILCCGGFIGTGVPEELHVEMENRFVETKSPKNLTLYYAAGQGDKKDRGLNHYAHEGLVKRAIGGHFGLAPKLVPLIAENKIEAYNLPQGIITHMYRAAAGKKPFVVSHVGLGTFVDPKNGGGKLNDITKEELVSKISFDGKDYLQYKNVFPNVCFLKGTFADENGNITMEKEPLTLEGLSIATATKNNGGIVIVQVEAKHQTTDPKAVKIPGIMVDYVVVASDAKYQMQTFGTQHTDDFITTGSPSANANANTELDTKKIIARRAAMLLSKNDHVLNYGIGVPEFVAQVLFEEGVDMKQFTPTVEPGPIAGVPAGGLDFGASRFPQAIIDQPYMFDFYDGGGLDFAFLGLAECDDKGSINVSKFGGKVTGCGGFINITQNAKRLAFLGTFTAGKLETACEDNKLVIKAEGKNKKFVKQVEQITFSGPFASSIKQEVYYITERAVFKLEADGLTLVEIAPGIDLQTQVLDQMDFKPIIAKDLKTMDSRIFASSNMGLKL